MTHSFVSSTPVKMAKIAVPKSRQRTLYGKVAYSTGVGNIENGVLFVDWRVLPILFESSELFLSPIFGV